MAMEMTAEVMGTWIAMAGLVVGYMKEKNDAAKSLGRLEEKVNSLEQNITRVDSLRNEITLTNNQLIRVEAKLDALVALMEAQKKP
jgi:hypothetical protein